MSLLLLFQSGAARAFSITIEPGSYAVTGSAVIFTNSGEAVSEVPVIGTLRVRSHIWNARVSDVTFTLKVKDFTFVLRNDTIAFS